MTSYVASFRQFNQSFKIQLRVIYALLMREIITRYGRHNIGFMWLFVEPMMFTLGVAALWHFMKNSHGGGFSIIPFAITGYSTILMWRNSANRVGHAVQANMGLLYHKNVKVLDVFLARIFLESAGATISFIVLMLLFISIGEIELPSNFLLMVQGWFLLFWFTIALSLLVGAIFELSEVLDRFWHAITYLLFPVSGTGFFVNWFPKDIQSILLWLPMVHSTEMLRHGYYGELIPTYENPIYLIWVNIILSFFGLALVGYVSNKLEASS